MGTDRVGTPRSLGLLRHPASCPHPGPQRPRWATPASTPSPHEVTEPAPASTPAESRARPRSQGLRDPHPALPESRRRRPGGRRARLPLRHSGVRGPLGAFHPRTRLTPPPGAHPHAAGTADRMQTLRSTSHRPQASTRSARRLPPLPGLGPRHPPRPPGPLPCPSPEPQAAWPASSPGLGHHQAAPAPPAASPRSPAHRAGRQGSEASGPAGPRPTLIRRRAQHDPPGLSPGTEAELPTGTARRGPRPSLCLSVPIRQKHPPLGPSDPSPAQDRAAAASQRGARHGGREHAPPLCLWQRAIVS